MTEPNPALGAPPARAARWPICRRMAPPIAAILLVLLLSPDASAATVTVRPDRGSPYLDEVYYVAGPRESNRLLVSYADDARSVTVSDRGAVITPEGPCASVDAHSVVCTAVDAGRLWLDATRVSLGDRDDRVSTTSPGAAVPAVFGGVTANGGPGDDILIGGARPDHLDGGRGADVLVGRGNEGEFSLDQLTGGPGRDRLRGGDGPDLLSPGGGRDSLRCGGDSDFVSRPERRELVKPDCELLGFPMGEDGGLAIPPYPVASKRGSVSFKMSCPDSTSLQGEPGFCDGPLTLREAASSRRLLGTGRIRDKGERTSWTVRVRLTDLGRRRAKDPHGVLATISISGRNLPRAAWTIHLTAAG